MLIFIAKTGIEWSILLEFTIIDKIIPRDGFEILKKTHGEIFLCFY
jgi:hypothetical protein